MCRTCLARATDQTLVAAVRRGDDEAFAEIHDRYREPLERFAARMVPGNALGPEDVVQEVFVRAHGAMLRNDRHIELKPWLYTAVRNRCLDELRKRTATAIPEDHEPASAAADPGLVLLDRERLREVLAGIADLPGRQRQVLVQGAIAGRSVASLAEELGVSEGAVKNLTHRARMTLHASATG